VKARLAVFLVVAAAVAASAAWAVIPSGNLLLNPGAEDGASGAAPPGWTTTLDFQALAYTTGGGFPGPNDPGCPDRGNNFFWAGNNAMATATQNVSVSGAATEIDTGTVDSTLSGYLGGFSNQEDQMKVEMIYLDASLTELARAQIGPVTAADRGNVTSMLLRSTTADVPALTRTIRVVQTGTRAAGSSNDAYSDCLSLTLAAGPTAVAARSFTAQRTLRGTVVRWRTAQELDVLGFDLYRIANGKTVKVNRTLIRAKARGAGGATYSVLDRRAPGARTVYRLRLVGLDGRSAWVAISSVAPRADSAPVR